MLGRLRQPRIVGGDGAAAAGGDDLVAVEAEGGKLRPAAGRLALVATAERFGRVLDHRQVPFRGQRQQRLHVDGMAEGMHRHDRAEAPSGAAVDDAVAAPLGNVAQIGGEPLGIDAEGDGVAVDEMRQRAAIADGVGGGDEGQRRRQHLVARPDPGEQQRDMQRRRAVDHGDRMRGARRRRHLLLEAGDEAADRGDKGAVEALLDVIPLLAGKTRLMQRRACDALGQRLAQRGDGALDVESGLELRLGHQRL